MRAGEFPVMPRGAPGSAGRSFPATGPEFFCFDGAMPSLFKRLLVLACLASSSAYASFKSQAKSFLLFATTKVCSA